jgi:transposase
LKSALATARRAAGGRCADRACPKDYPLIDAVPADFVMADAAYDIDRLPKIIADKGAVAVIPNNPPRARKSRLDRHLNALRQLIGCCCSRLKQFRRVATRRENTARNDLALMIRAGAILWFR